MADKKQLMEMRKQDKDYGFIDIFSACQHSTLRYYFVNEEQQAKKIEDTTAIRIENLLRMTLSTHEKAAALFEEALTAWKSSETRTLEAIKQLNEQYKEIIIKNVEKSPEPSPLTQISSEDLDYILTLVHDRNIEDVELLNVYKPWSAEVYGETSFAFAKHMCDEIGLEAGDTFLDLGSGVGRVVMQVAALYHCKKAVGIELLETRASFAQDMDVEFRALMAWLGKKHGEYELIHGDFLKDVHKAAMMQSNVIFCNNFAFEDTLNYQLKSVFADRLPEGVRILVSKSLRDEKFRITEKTESDGAAILPVRRTFQGKMSWTDNPVTFYLHVVDSELLAKFQESRRDPKKRAQYEEEQRQLRPKYYESSSEQSQDMDPDLTEEENVNPTGKRGGCTTRSQWKTSVKRRRVANDTAESDDEDSENTHSEASTQRTRSIPSQDSSTTRAASKRKRGRPAKSSARSAPSSSSAGGDAALQSLFNHTLKSINTVDRTVGPGCELDTVQYSPSDELPPEYQTFLRNIEGPMKRLWKAVQAASYPAEIEGRLPCDKVKLEQLKEREKSLISEVNVLRSFCKKLMESLFKGRNLPLPSSADHLSRDSRNMLQTTNLLRERHSTLKDDIHWLENTQLQEKAQFEQTVMAVNGRHPGKMAPPLMVNGAFSGHGAGPPENDRKHHATPARQSSSSYQHAPSTNGPAPATVRSQTHSSANTSHEFVKPRPADMVPDAMDLSRVHSKREGPIGRGLQSYGQSLEASQTHASGPTGKVTSPRQSSSHNAANHAKQLPPQPGPANFMSELGRVIESSLRGPPSTAAAPQETAATAGTRKNEGNLRGLSPVVHPRQPQESSSAFSAARDKSTTSDASPRSHQTSSRNSAQAGLSFAIPAQDVQSRQYPGGAIVHGQVVYPGAIIGTGHPCPPGNVYGDYAMTPAAVFGGHPLAGNYAAQPETNQMIPGWAPSQQYSSLAHFDAAAVAGAFSGVPGGGQASGSFTAAMKFPGPAQAVGGGFEAISPPPR